MFGDVSDEGTATMAVTGATYDDAVLFETIPATVHDAA
jgi:hypothetical protein